MIKIVKPDMLYFKLTPNNSIRNYDTYKIARAIASLYKGFNQRTSYKGKTISYAQNPKISFTINISKNEVGFYFGIPVDNKNAILDKVNNTWDSIVVEPIDQIPQLDAIASKCCLSYTKEDALSLLYDRRSNKLLESNLNIIDILQDNDRVIIEYTFNPIPQFTWPSQYKTTIDTTSKGLPVDRNKISAYYLTKLLLSLVLGAFRMLSEALGDTKHNQTTQLITPPTLTPETIKKGTDLVLGMQVKLYSQSSNKKRQDDNLKILAHSFDVISGDNRLTAKPITLLNNMNVNKVSANECSNFIALPGRELLEKYTQISKTQTQETQVPSELQSGVINLGTNAYKGVIKNAYLSTDFDYQFLSLVLIAPNRAGKSKYLANLANDAIKAGECVIIPDYIGSCQLSAEIAGVIPKDKVLEIHCNDHNSLQGLGYNEVPTSTDPFIQYKNAKEQTALLTVLVNSINADGADFTARMGRFFEAASLVVFLNGGTIKDVFAVLTNHKIRKRYVGSLPVTQKERMVEYIDYLKELDAVERNKVVGTKTHLITGAIDRLQKLKVNAYLEAMLNQSIKGNIDLVKEMQKNQLIVIKMPQRMFLTDNEKDVYTTYWLTKLWLALQIREEQIQDRNKMLKVNLIIDELYQVNNAEKFLTKKLSQLPKFNIKPVISCHYLNQIRILREELRSANASYMLISGCDKVNYRELREELYPYTEDDLLNLKRYNCLNLIKYDKGYAKFITQLPKPLNNV